MNILKIFFLIILISIVLSTCSKKKTEPEIKIPDVVTKDIQEGIEKYIEDERKKGNGYFKFKSQGKDYSFKLVRVHTEYLANLGPRKHFACVDLVDKKGDIYDVDFFMEGDPGKMEITETIIHKLNGKPFYAWQQASDKTWKKVPIDKASNELKEVKSGKDKFQFKYYTIIPEIKKEGRMWIPLAKSDRFQQVKVDKISGPEYKETIDKKHGNKVLYFNLHQGDSNKVVEISYSVVRLEKSAYKSEKDEPEKHLKENKLVPSILLFKKTADKVVKNLKGDMVRARALYDHVLDQMQYIKYGKGWGNGDAVFACDNGIGNCTDYHSYFIALARSVGIPARFAIGASIPTSRDEGGISGYHCWAEFHADGKWWPVDISEADKYSSLTTYYFGHHPANRFEFTKGRDLEVEPLPITGPINFLAYPFIEADGKFIKRKPKFAFKRI